MESNDLQRRVASRVQELVAALEAARAERHVSKAALDARLGRGRGYHAHLLAGRITLTLEHVFQILEGLEIEPGEFFANLYGLKGANEWEPVEREYFERLERSIDRVVGQKVEDVLDASLERVVSERIEAALARDAKGEAS